MDSNSKGQIVAAALGYMAEHGLSQGEMARRASINAAYLSAMVKGEDTVGEAQTVIKDSYYERLASEIGFSLERELWPHVNTMQFLQIIAALKDAKNGDSTSALRAVLGPAGYSKTYSVDKFCEKNPKHTYRITLDDQMSLYDVVEELLVLMGLPLVGNKHKRKASIALKLRDIRQQGGKPLLIFDEAENASLAVLRFLKSLYDGIHKHCVIVLIGTDQLENRLLRDVKKNIVGMPQFYSRLKSGITYLSDAVEFDPFFEQLRVDKELRKLLRVKCKSYRELNTYLLPAMKEAEKQREPLTVNNFKLYMNV